MNLITSFQLRNRDPKLKKMMLKMLSAEVLKTQEIFGIQIKPTKKKLFQSHLLHPSDNDLEKLVAYALNLAQIEVDLKRQMEQKEKKLTKKGKKGKAKQTEDQSLQLSPEEILSSKHQETNSVSDPLFH